jgi:hypothetical protein
MQLFAKLDLMKYKFKARIYKVGINPCVDVSSKITSKMEPTKGYIPVNGEINGFEFMQTLVPVRNSDYRLYVNGPMMKGADVSVGDMATFSIAQNFDTKSRAVPMNKELWKKLKEENLLEQFKKLSPSRQKEINRYLANLKSEEALTRNIKKVIRAMKGEAKSTLFRLG